MRKLRQCIESDDHWFMRKIIEKEEDVIAQFMERADKGKSLTDIWAITVENGLSILYYTATLPTWFFALNLVRVKHASNGNRRLEII